MLKTSIGQSHLHKLYKNLSQIFVTMKKKIDITQFGNIEEYGKALCIRGYHIYCKVWEAKAGETLPCEMEQQNTCDRYMYDVGAQSCYLLFISKNFMCLIFVDEGIYEIILTMKFSRSTVHVYTLITHIRLCSAVRGVIMTYFALVSSYPFPPSQCCLL